MSNKILETEIMDVKNGNKEVLDSICNKLKKIIECNYKNYTFLPKDIYLYIVKEALFHKISVIDIKIITDMNSYLKKDFDTIVKEKLGEVVRDKVFDIIDYFIKSHSTPVLEVLCIFLKSIHYQNSIDEDIKLLKKYSCLEEEIQLFIGDAKKIKTEKIDKVSKNKIMAQMIRAYLIENDIEEIIEVDEEISFSYDTEECKDLDLIKLYMKDINRVKLLSKNEEIELFKRYELGDAEAFKQIAEANLRWVVKIAKHYCKANSFHTFLDLIEEGNFGLFKAIEKFDYRKGYKFSNYAIWWIRKNIMSEVSLKEHTIRIPIGVVDLNRKIEQFKENFYLQNRRYPSVLEIATSMKKRPEYIQKVLEYSQYTKSLNISIAADETGETKLEDFVKDTHMNVEEEVLFHDLQLQLQEAIEVAGLTDKERGVLSYRFGFYDGCVHTLESIGEIYGVTREAIRKNEATALNKLQGSKCRQLLSGYIEEYEKGKPVEKDMAIKSETKSNTTEEVFDYNFTSLFDYLSIQKNQLDILLDCILCFHDEDLELLTKRYGKNYDGVGSSKLKKKESNRLQNFLLPQLKQAIEQIVKLEKDSMVYESFLEHFTIILQQERANKKKGNTKKHLLHEEKEVFPINTGEKETKNAGTFVSNEEENANLKENVNFSIVAKSVDLENIHAGADYCIIAVSIVNNLLADRKLNDAKSYIKTLLCKENREIFMKQDYQVLGMLFQLEEVKSLVNMSFTVEEAIVIFLLYLVGEDNLYTIDTIVSLLKISVEDIKRIAKEGINKYQCLMTQGQVNKKKVS